VGEGSAAVTRGGDLDCHFVVHTVEPSYHDYDSESANQILRIGFLNSIEAAKALNLKSISFNGI